MNQSEHLSAENDSLFQVEDSRNIAGNITFATIKLIFIPLIIGGNGLVIASLLVFRRLRNLTNYLLLSLSASDLLVAVFTIPLYVAFYLQKGSLTQNRTACLTWFGSVILGCGASLYNLLLIVIDRFVAIHFPFHYARLKTPRKVGITLTVLWIYIVVLSFLPLMGWNNWSRKKKCDFYGTLPKAYVIWAAYFTVGICTLVSTLLYGKIFTTVWQHRKQIHAVTVIVTRENLQMEKEIRTTRLTAIVFLLFILCWAPYVCVGPLMYTGLSLQVVEIIKNCTLVLGFGNSLVNPIVFGLARTQFKCAYKLLVTTRVSQWRKLSVHPLDKDHTHGVIACVETCNSQQ
ncbi:histamine H2 receptor-like [Pomacea canaliculata]|uniref:histamine H2 receptor-like n=1 Tax=Pomacea canaliculata TaxID=400727 RepID=UPI000D730A38|nr:histamine H2 receptor-like [Pomacea canaliculata]